MYLIKQVSEFSGVSMRTLRHYDQIGLLSPKKQENGYRYYTRNDLSLLQTILFYKYLGFSLKEIKKLVKVEKIELLPHLKQQLILMEKEKQKQKLLTLISTLQQTIESHERSLTMSAKETFKGFVYHENEKYQKAAEDLYGRKVVTEAIAKQKGKEQEITDGFNRIFFSFAKNLSDHQPATSEANVRLAKELHQHLQIYAFDCPLDVFSQIGYGYVQDPEFKRNIDRFGDGVA